MPYIAGIAFVAIAVILFVLIPIWGGLVFVVVGGVLLALVFAARARDTKVTRSRTDPTGTPRSARGNAETANQRVGQP
jgi:Flp pilus assembly protein TadB